MCVCVCVYVCADMDRYITYMHECLYVHGYMNISNYR